MSEIRSIRVQAVPVEELDGETLLRPELRGDQLTVRLNQAEATGVLCDQITGFQQTFIGSMLMHTEAADGATSVEKRAAITSGRCEFVPGRALPAGFVCWPIISAGEIIWLIRDGEMSEEMRLAINAFISQLFGGGAWL